jgi:hypothetical protein
MLSISSSRIGRILTITEASGEHRLELDTSASLFNWLGELARAQRLMSCDVDCDATQSEDAVLWSADYHLALPTEAEAIRDSVSRSDASDDDMLDALAALWTARRISRWHAKASWEPAAARRVRPSYADVGVVVKGWLGGANQRPASRSARAPDGTTRDRRRRSLRYPVRFQRTRKTDTQDTRSEATFWAIRFGLAVLRVSVHASEQRASAVLRSAIVHHSWSVRARSAARTQGGLRLAEREDDGIRVSRLQSIRRATDSFPPGCTRGAS